MPMKGSEWKKGIDHNGGRKSGGTGVTSPGLMGDGTTVHPLGIDKAHGNEGRDERSARNFAERGNELVRAPAAHGPRGYK